MKYENIKKMRFQLPPAKFELDAIGYFVYVLL